MDILQVVFIVCHDYMTLRMVVRSNGDPECYQICENISKGIQLCYGAYQNV